MLNDVYNFIRESIAKIFTTSSLNTFSLADELFRTSASCANIVIRVNDDVSEDCLLGLTMVFLHGLLHLTDRQAFSVIPAKRIEVMDQLVLVSCGLLINSFSGPNITVAEKKKLLDTAVDRYNEINTFYGSCKKLFPEDDESPKGTFIWEFGKQFASSANHAMDLAFITLGDELLLDVIKHWKISEKLSTLNLSHSRVI